MQERKVAIVTGADRGIGRGLANRIAEAGYDVFMTYYRNEELAQEVKREVEQKGVRCHTFKADFRSAEVTQKTVKTAVECFGRLDLVVNNAAISRPADISMNMRQRSWIPCLRSITADICLLCGMPYGIGSKTGRRATLSIFLPKAQLCPIRNFHFTVV